MKSNEDKNCYLCANNCARGIIGVLIFFLIIFLIVKIGGSIKSFGYIGRDISSPNTISVSGKGEMAAKVDTASFTFNVIEESTNVSDAQDRAARKTNSIIEYLKTEKIEDKDIKTINYNIYPRYNYVKMPVVKTNNEIGSFPIRDNRILIGYEINQGIEVKVRDIAKAGEILSGVGGLGASNVSGLNFSIDKEDDLREQTRSLAIEDAKKNAKTLARDLGVKLVRIINFSESGYYPIYRGKFSAYADAGGAEARIVPEIPTGENKITSQVNIVYEIR